MQYRATLQMVDDQGNDCGSLAGELHRSPSAAVKDVLRKLEDLSKDERERSTDLRVDPRSLDRRAR